MPEIAKLQEQVHTLFQNDERHERELDGLRKDVADCNEKILNQLTDLRKEMASRLPNWATLLISVLTACLGGLLGRGVM